MLKGIEKEIKLRDGHFNVNSHDYYELYFDEGMPAMNVKKYLNSDTGEISFGLTGLKDMVSYNGEYDHYEVLEFDGKKITNVSEILRNLVEVYQRETDSSKSEKLAVQINQLDYLQEKIWDVQDELSESL